MLDLIFPHSMNINTYCLFWVVGWEGLDGVPLMHRDLLLLFKTEQQTIFTLTDTISSVSGYATLLSMFFPPFFIILTKFYAVNQSFMPFFNLLIFHRTSNQFLKHCEILDLTN